MNKQEQVVSLIEQEKFKEAIEFIDKSEDESLLIYKAISILGLGKLEESLKFIEDNNKLLLKYEPSKTITLHVSIYIENEDFVKAFEVINKYEELPYISQEVEETFASMKDSIRKAQKEKLEKKEIKFSYEENKNILLTSDDSEKMMLALQEACDKKHIKKSLEYIKEFLLRELKKEHYFLKSYVLGLLSGLGIDEELKVLTKTDGIQTINPSKLVPPVATKEGKEFIATLERLSSNDVTIFKNAVILFNQYYVSKIPVDIFKEDTIDNLSKAFILLAKRYMGNNEKEDENIEELARKIEQTLI